MRRCMKKMSFLILLFVAGCLQQEASSGKVVSIADGDTFTLLTSGNNQIRIRLHGIDCPEKGQDFGTAARQQLSSLIFGKQVRIEKKDTDRYGRTIAIVYTNGGQSVNEQMLQAGLAWHYRQYDKNPDWERLEKEARRNRRGLWSQRDPTPPWLFRKEQRETAVP